MEYRFHEQLERVLGSSASSTVNDIMYDVEELNDDDESQDDEEDLQFLGHSSQVEMGMLPCFCTAPII